MRIDILTLFPESLGDVLSDSILGRAQDRGIIRIEAHQIRDYTASKQCQVDDYPYGGGRGAIMQADPLYRCWEAVCDEAGGPVHTVYMSPCGKTFCQADAIRLSKMENLVLVCGLPGGEPLQRPSGVSPVQPSCGLAWPGGAGNSPFRQPPESGSVAAAPSPPPHPGQTTGYVPEAGFVQQAG